jgi:hypothetical protein
MALPIAELGSMPTERLIEWHDQAFGGMASDWTPFIGPPSMLVAWRSLA